MYFIWQAFSITFELGANDKTNLLGIFFILLNAMSISKYVWRRKGKIKRRSILRSDKKSVQIKSSYYDLQY